MSYTIDWVEALIEQTHANEPVNPSGDAIVRLGWVLAARKGTDWRTGEFTASQSVLSDQSRLSVSTVKRTLSWLKTSGWISDEGERVAYGKRLRAYRLTIPSASSDESASARKVPLGRSPDEPGGAQLPSSPGELGEVRRWVTASSQVAHGSDLGSSPGELGKGHPDELQQMEGNNKEQRNREDEIVESEVEDVALPPIEAFSFASHSERWRGEENELPTGGDKIPSHEVDPGRESPKALASTDKEVPAASQNLGEGTPSVASSGAATKKGKKPSEWERRERKRQAFLAHADRIRALAAEHGWTLETLCRNCGTAGGRFPHSRDLHCIADASDSLAALYARAIGKEPTPYDELPFEDRVIRMEAFCEIMGWPMPELEAVSA